MMKTNQDISYTIEKKGHQEYIVIPLHLFEENSLEDLHDILFAKHQLKTQDFVPFQ